MALLSADKEPLSNQHCTNYLSMQSRIDRLRNITSVAVLGTFVDELEGGADWEHRLWAGNMCVQATEQTALEVDDVFSWLDRAAENWQIVIEDGSEDTAHDGLVAEALIQMAHLPVYYDRFARNQNRGETMETHIESYYFLLRAAQVISEMYKSRISEYEQITSSRNFKDLCDISGICAELSVLLLLHRHQISKGEHLWLILPSTMHQNRIGKPVNGFNPRWDISVFSRHNSLPLYKIQSKSSQRGLRRSVKENGPYSSNVAVVVVSKLTMAGESSIKPYQILDECISESGGRSAKLGTVLDYRTGLVIDKLEASTCFNTATPTIS